MRNLLKLLALLLLFCGLLVPIACDKDDGVIDELPTSAFDETITAVVENGNAYDSIVDKVVAKMHFDMTDDFREDHEEIASANYTNGGFTMKLPTTLDNKFLLDWKFAFNLDSIFNFDETSDIRASDTNAKIATLLGDGDFIAYDREGNLIDYLYHSNRGSYRDSTYAIGDFLFADRDVTITGSTSKVTTLNNGMQSIETIKFSLSLKKGWNISYWNTMPSQFVRDEKKIFSETEISNNAVRSVKWHFSKDMNKVTKNTEKRNARFSRFQ